MFVLSFDIYYNIFISAVYKITKLKIVFSFFISRILSKKRIFLLWSSACYGFVEDQCSLTWINYNISSYNKNLLKSLYTIYIVYKLNYIFFQFQSFALGPKEFAKMTFHRKNQTVAKKKKVNYNVYSFKLQLGCKCLFFFFFCYVYCSLLAFKMLSWHEP